MRLCIHRGSNQIGGSCVEIECGGQRLLLDFGLPLELEKEEQEYLPQIAGIDGSDPDLLGVLISHSHPDHFGLLPYLSPKVLVGMGNASRRIIKAAAPFMKKNWAVPHGWGFRNGQRIHIGPFLITPYLVDHSAYDSYALLIEGNQKRVFYSGDFRSHGRKASLFQRMLSHPPENIDTLLLEGTNLGKKAEDHPAKTETEIEAELTGIFSRTPGLVMVHASAQNIDRVVSIMRACIKTKRKLIIDLYTAAVLEATENPSIPQSTWDNVALFIPQSQRIQIKENAWFDLLKRHSKNRIFIDDIRETSKRSVILFRPLYRHDLEKGNCLEGAAYIYSLWEGYWERGSYAAISDWLEAHGVSKISVHTSGHASPDDLQRIAEALSPKRIVPIHTLYPEKYQEIFTNVEIHNNDEWWEV